MIDLKTSFSQFSQPFCCILLIDRPLQAANVTRILVVKECPQKREQIAHLLRSVESWRVEFAEDNQAAIERLTLIPPDVVLTDLHQAEIGLDLVRCVRRDFEHVPVVLITSPASQAVAIEALRVGATSFTPAENLDDDLVRTVRQVVDMSKHLRHPKLKSHQPVCNRKAFVLENDPGLIGPLIEHLQGSLPSWSDRDRLHIGMAMDEALVNAMHHGNLEVASKLREVDDALYYRKVEERCGQHPYCQRKVKLEVEVSEEHICLQISDEGPGFDPSRIANPCTEENVLKVSGRGLFLIRSFMDQVAHNQLGNQITMTKLRQGQL